MRTLGHAYSFSSPSRNRRRAGAILEALIALAIFLVGITAILNYFPLTTRTAYDAADLSRAVTLAHMKAEEIRRAARQDPLLIQTIKTRTTPSDPVVFAQDNRLAYSFSGRSLIDPDHAPGMARVIVRYAQDFRPSQDVLFELLFEE